MSFKWKTILGIATIELFFLSLLVWQAARFIQDLGETDIAQRASDTVTLATSVLLDSLISYDLATIAEQIQQLGALDGVTYVVLEGHGKTLATSGDYPNPEPSSEDSIAQVKDGTYDIVHGLEAAGQTLGQIKMGFSLKELYSVTRTAKTRLYLIAFLELLLVGVCSWLFARFLTSRILMLEKASATLQAGGAVSPIPVVGNDEISSTIKAFNKMSAALLEREQGLKTVNRRLEEANDQLNEREREVWSLFNAAPDGIAVLDREGKISFANEKLIRLLGAGSVAVIGRALGDFIKPVDGAKPSEESSWNLSGLAAGQFKVINFKRETLFVELNWSGFRSSDVSRTIAIIRDKSHEWKLEKAVKLNEQLKTNLVDSSLDALVTINGHGDVIDFSQSAEVLFGWKKKEIVGRRMQEYLIPNEQRSAHNRGMAHFLETGEGPLIGQRVETKAMRKNGTEIPIELALTATWIDSDVFVTAAIRDITERKEREEELLAAKASAEEASQAKSRFLSFMSHEIRSPMNAVLGALALINERGKLQDSEQYYLDLARDSGDALLKVVNEVLDFSKIEAGHVQFRHQPCALSTLANSVLSAIVAKKVKPGVELSANIDSAIPSLITTDGEKLRQVLTILLDNAYKFTDRGQVTLAVEKVNFAGDTSTSNHQLRLSVKDTGPGIPEEKIETIFSEFEQTDALRDSGYGGTGLGLAIARRLVTGLGGQIWVESKLGVGSTFFVQIPFNPADADPSNVIDTEQADTSGAGLEINNKKAHRVLLVDDVEANLVIGAELLKSRGYLVDVACDGLDAVEKAATTNYAIILMDMRMPKLNGLEATEQIRSSSPRNATIPIIALTANAERSEIERCLRGGMDDFVSKPFNIESLSQTIEKHLTKPKREEQEMQKQNESAEPQPDLLSKDVLDQLIKDTSAESLPMMISVFINEIKKRLEGIESAERAKDELEMREQAHALKSCSGTFGGKKLQAVAHELELQACQSNACSNEALLKTVKQVAEETLLAYSDYRNHL